MSGCGFIRLLLPLLFFTSIAFGKSLNTTKVLGKYDHLSTFNKYLSETGVVKEVDGRSSVTVFVPPNNVLDPAIATVGPNNLLVIADILRYHCLLQYLELSEIHTMTNASGILLTTLYQTTGRATEQSGFLNVSVSKSGEVHLIGVGSNATVVKSVEQHPYDMSYMEIDRVLMPTGLGKENGAAPSINNLTSVLKAKGDFNTFLGILAATGVDKSLKSMPAVTLLAPTDDAFKALPPGTLDSLPQAQKIALLQFHCIPTYLTMGALQSVKTQLPTVASSSSGGFALNVSTSQGKGVSFMTGINKAEIEDTEMDSPPTAVYSINRVLLPPEIFAASGPSPAEAPGPALAPSPLSPSPVPVPVPVPSPSLSPSPVPAPGPSPITTPTLSPSPAPVLVPAASPPAPPTAQTPTNSAPATAPSASPNGSMKSASLDFGVLVLVAAVSALFL